MEAHSRQRKRAKKEEKNHIEAKHIPHEIVHDILLKLPARSLQRSKAVCKSWRALISDPKFINSHLNYGNKGDTVSFCRVSGIDNRPESVSLTIIDGVALESERVKLRYAFDFQVKFVEVLGSCNGLLLIGVSSMTLLWNPLTGEYNRIASGLWEWRFNEISKCGLGYDPSLDEYKGVLFVVGQSYMYICSNTRSGHGGWKKVMVGVHDFPYLSEINYDEVLGITVNGAPHWLVSNNSAQENTRTIICFDMAEEKFKSVPTPTSWLSICTIAVLERRLCTIVYNGANGGVDFWTMKDYGVKESWTKLFLLFHPMEPLGYTKNGDEVVCLTESKLVAFNLNTQQEKCIIPITNGFGFTYVESLVSPGCNGAKKRDNRVMRRRRKWPFEML